MKTENTSVWPSRELTITEQQTVSFNLSFQVRERDLKIEATGDVWGDGIKPKIRLCGLWLEKAGFKPGDRVRVISERPGELILRATEASAREFGSFAK